jgi:xylose isomerase
MIEVVAKNIRPRLLENVDLGIEMHYDAEVDDNNAAVVADALVSNKLSLAMITPGAHTHFAYGGISSLDKNKRKAAEELGTRRVDLAHGKLRKA